MVVAVSTMPVAEAGVPDRLPGAAAPSTEVDARLADVEFRLSWIATGEERADLSLALWRTGVVERVVASDDGEGYRLYLRDPSNLIHLSEVRRVLSGHRAVAHVDTLFDFIVRSATE